MAMSAGSVTISNAGVASGSGLARELYDAHDAALGTAFGSAYDNVKNIDNAKVRKGLAVMANAYAGALVTHLADNAKASVARDTITDSGGDTSPAGVDKLFPIV